MYAPRNAATDTASAATDLARRHLCHWDNTEPIERFANSMYVVHPSSENGPATFYHFPRRTTWDTYHEFDVTMAIPVVRDVQHIRSLLGSICARSFSMMLQRKARRFGEGEDILGFIALKTQAHQHNMGTVFSLGSRVMLQLQSEQNKLRPRLFSTWGEPLCHGVIIENPDGCAKTGTDFCIKLDKNTEVLPLHNEETFEKVDDALLVSASIEVTINTTAATRDLEGAHKLADPLHEPDSLKNIRAAIMQDPAKIEHRIENFCNKKPELWEAFKRQVDRECAGDRDQYECVLSLEKVDNGFAAVVGAAGTGKTAALAMTVVGALTQDYKVFIVAPTRSSVDGVARTLWSTLPPNFRSGENERLFLRLKARSTELRAFLAVNSYRNGASNSMTMRMLTDREIDDLTDAWAETVPEWQKHDAKFRELWERGETFLDAVKETSLEASNQKRSCPTQMTTGWHIHSLIVADIEAAINSCERVRKPSTMADIDIEDAIKQELATDADGADPERLMEAMRIEQISVENPENRTHSIKQRRQYRRFCQLAHLYVKKKGNISLRQQWEFVTEWSLVMEKVIARLDGVISTCNNAGSDITATKFRPDLIFCDDAGQVNLASFANVVTAFTNWKAIYIFGDTQQSRPFSISGDRNEFFENTRLSVLELFEIKDFNVMRLRMQYRMAPAIAEWVGKHFYGGTLTDHPSVEEDNKVRLAGRRISREFYGIKGVGSVYWHINVINGISRPYQNSMTLVNYANTGAIAKLVQRFVAAGINPSSIGILTYYVGQKYLHITRLDDATNDQKWKVGDVEISTVDAYRGKELPVGILDIVSAPPQFDKEKTTSHSVDEDILDEESQPRHGLPPGIVSTHVMNAQRLCSGLTRFKDVLVVISKTKALAATSKLKKSDAVSKMVQDANRRGLIYNDTRTKDDRDEFIEQKRLRDEAARQQSMGILEE